MIFVIIHIAKLWTIATDLIITCSLLGPICYLHGLATCYTCWSGPRVAASNWRCMRTVQSAHHSLHCLRLDCSCDGERCLPTSLGALGYHLPAGWATPGWAVDYEVDILRILRIKWPYQLIVQFCSETKFVKCPPLFHSLIPCRIVGFGHTGFLW